MKQTKQRAEKSKQKNYCPEMIWLLNINVYILTAHHVSYSIHLSILKLLLFLTKISMMILQSHFSDFD
uniref:Uncharacterized protein n=1 Tax=Onchocerca volvulus TaxID=6282 RepID=A0A8R1TJS9_ONCVO